MIVEQLKKNRDARISLRETENILRETERMLERERQERMDADRKLREEQEKHSTLISQVVSEVVPIILAKIPAPINGKDAIVDYEKIVQSVVPLIPKPKDAEPLDKQAVISDIISSMPIAKDGYTPKAGIDYMTKGETTEFIKTELETFIEWAKRTLKTVRGKRGGGGDIIHFEDISTQTDGNTKIFTVPKSRKGVLFGSDFPTVLMENNGFAINAARTQITLQTDNAPSQGSQLLYQYVV